MRMAVRFGVFVPQGWRMDLVDITDPVAKYEAMTRVAQAVDALPAFDSIWVYDHFHTVPTPERETTFEAWTSTAALTRDTRRVHVGQMVTSAGYRHPAVLAKMASTVDVMSHGRLYFGLGAGWYEHEWRAYFNTFPETRERMRAFREACTIIYRMWTEAAPTYSGEYYSINAPINEPRGARQPHPAFWIGGGGEQVTLRLVARYGDACNIGGDPATVRHKLEVLRGHCEALGRDYEAIIKSSNLNVIPLAPGQAPEAATARYRAAVGMSEADFAHMYTIGEPEHIVARVREQVEAGIDYIIFYVPMLAYTLDPLHLLADEVIPRIQTQG